MKRILLTNDDGIESKGLKILEEAVKGLGKVYVVAPKRNQSSASRSLTKRKFLKIEKFDCSEGIERYAIDATPATCILIAVEKILKAKPDLVISGINLGENIGRTSYTASGTIGAALEATISYNVPAIAASIFIPIEFHESRDSYPVDFTVAKNYIKKISEYILKYPNNGLRKFDILNINFPSSAEDKGFKITVPAKNKFHYPKIIEKDGKYRLTHIVKIEKEDENTDVKTVHDGKVSITPLSFIRDTESSIGKIEKIFKNEVII